MLTAYRDRMLTMRDDDRIAFAIAMKNVGPEAGASLEHSHSQIVGLPFVPPRVSDELVGARPLPAISRRVRFCRLMHEELSSGQRVWRRPSTSWHGALLPAALVSKVWIAPREHQSRFEETSDVLLANLASLLQQVVQMVESHPRVAAFNYVLHSTPI